MTNAEAIFDLEQFALAPIGDGDLHRESIELALSALREQAEIVKCKNCIYQKDAKVNCKGFIICTVSNMEITDDDYCSYGAKMEDKP